MSINWKGVIHPARLQAQSRSELEAPKFQITVSQNELLQILQSQPPPTSPSKVEAVSRRNAGDTDVSKMDCSAFCIARRLSASKVRADQGRMIIYLSCLSNQVFFLLFLLRGLPSLQTIPVLLAVITFLFFTKTKSLPTRQTLAAA